MVHLNLTFRKNHEISGFMGSNWDPKQINELPWCLQTWRKQEKLPSTGTSWVIFPGEQLLPSVNACQRLLSRFKCELTPNYDEQNRVLHILITNYTRLSFTSQFAQCMEQVSEQLRSSVPRC